MKAIQDTQAVDKYKKRAAEMMLPDEYHECEFRTDWIIQHGWKVVLVEDGGHFRPWQIDRIVPVLQKAGYHHCVAVATEPLDPFPPCFELAIDTADFWEFNAECGLFRFMLMEETRSWAISCSELYDRFAGEKSLVEAMLDASIEEARKTFLAFAEPLSGGDPEYPPLKVAAHYAALSDGLNV